jgi:hypothetical protein
VVPVQLATISGAITTTAFNIGSNFALPSTIHSLAIYANTLLSFMDASGYEYYVSVLAFNSLNPVTAIYTNNPAGSGVMPNIPAGTPLYLYGFLQASAPT